MKNAAKNSKQVSDNIFSVYFFNMAMDQLDVNKRGNRYGKQLRSCQARVYETERFYILKSYDTFVAAIDKTTKCGFDVLRHEYGYTSTSAQHIAKFLHEYGAQNYRRYYPTNWGNDKG